MSSIIVLSSVLMQRSSLSWGRTIEPPELPQFLILAGTLAVGFILLLLLSNFINLYRTKEEETRELENVVKRLTVANLGFQEYARIIEEHERNRITRELHDVVGYTLTNITMMMERGIDLYKNDDIRNLLSMVVETRDHARNGHTEIRETLKRLRKINASQKQFSRIIDNMVKIFKSATKLDIDVEYANFPPHVDEAIGNCILRLIQEGMTNAVRHGKATYAKIVLYEDADGLLLRVYDNGRGCSKLQEGLGITGMRERLKNIGGSIEFKNTSFGFQFIARMPSRPKHGEYVLKDEKNTSFVS
jgi:signal transduction histidine kinase